MKESVKVSRRMPFIYATRGNELWNRLMAKPDKKLISHMIETGVTAQEILRSGPARRELEPLERITGLDREGMLSFAGYLCAMHDIGKCHPAFQDMIGADLDDIIKSVPGRRIRHEDYGVKVMRRIRPVRNSRTLGVICSVIGFHHQHEPVSIGRNNGFAQGEDIGLWEDMQSSLEKEVREVFEFNGNPDISKDDTTEFFHRMLGILIMSDWLSSGYMYKDTDGVFINRGNYVSTVRTACREFLDRNRMIYHAMDSVSFKSAFPFIDVQSPMQETVVRYMNTMPRVRFAIIEDTMGTGKTESGLYMASRMGRNGIYMAMPTNATSQAMKPRFDEFLARVGENESVRTGEWETQSENIDMMLWERNAKLRLTSPSVIGTADQCLMAARLIRYSDLRMLELSSKAVVFDEVHSYDAYTMDIIEKFLMWAKMFDIPVIMMSATLPAYTKKRLLSIYTDDDVIVEDGYPMLTVYDGAVRQMTPKRKGKSYVLNVDVADKNSDEDIVTMACQKIRDGGCLAVIVNTVDNAIDIYRKFKKTADCDVYLIHGRFPKAVKEEKTTHLVSLFGKDKTDRPKKAIVVATQIIEQSVDVDFDYMISAIAPIDMLFQRAGRLRRHRDGMRALTVVTGLDGPYEKDVIERTQNLLKKQYTVPQDMHLDVSGVYCDEIMESHAKKIQKAKAGTGNLPLDTLPLKANLSRRYQSVRDGAESVLVAITDADVSTLDREQAQHFIERHAIQYRWSALKDIRGHYGTGYLQDVYIVSTDNGTMKYSDEFGLENLKG